MFFVLGLLFATSAFGQIVSVGDTGTGTEEQYKVAKAIERWCDSNTCEYALLNGDNFYEKGVKSVDDEQWQSKFEKPYQNLDFKFYAVLGNHDHKGNAQAQVNYSSDRWSMPDRYYTFVRGDVQIFGLDTDQFDRKQYDWLKKELAKSTSKWKLVFGHHPIKTYGEHGPEKKLNKLSKLFDKLGVDFYLCGHEHDLQVIESGKVVYLVSGAGAKTRKTKKGKKSKFASGELGFMYISFAGDTATIKVINAENEVKFTNDYRKK